MTLNPSLNRELTEIIHHQPPLVPPISTLEKEEIREMEYYTDFLHASMQVHHPNSLEYVDIYLSYARLMRRLDQLRRPDEGELIKRFEEVKRLREVMKSKLNQT